MCGLVQRTVQMSTLKKSKADLSHDGDDASKLPFFSLLGSQERMGSFFNLPAHQVFEIGAVIDV
jgi:hypothetical protein